MFDFSGRYAVVTGGAKGIGEATVRRLIADNAYGVAILDIINSESLAKELDPSGRKVLPLLCDISDRTAVAAAFRTIYVHFGRVDFMINNAGIAKDNYFHALKDEEWDSVFDVNLKGAYNCTKQVIGQMRKQESGRIIFFSSIAIYGIERECNYSATKGALYALTKNLAREQIDKNITVNCVIPGPIETDLFRYVSGEQADNTKQTDIPRQRIGQPKDVASLICYLCTDEAYFINGARIDINGGIS